MRHPCHETVAATLATLKVGSIKDIFDRGLHEFLTEFIGDNNKLGTRSPKTTVQRTMRLKITHRTDYAYEAPVPTPCRGSASSPTATRP